MVPMLSKNPVYWLMLMYGCVSSKIQRLIGWYYFSKTPRKFVFGRQIYGVKYLSFTTKYILRMPCWQK